VRYTLHMETVALVMLAVVVAIVAIDAIGRLDERRARREPAPSRDEDPSSTQKIIVDLTKRR
jgi:hypothetical protein